jgi:hypothetical protein
MVTGQIFLSKPIAKRNQIMKNSITRLSLLGLLAAAVAGAPMQLFAQNTDKVPTEKKTASQTNDTAKAEKSTKVAPFHGKLDAVDNVAKTITVGNRTFQITSATKIKKTAKPAMLQDGVVGEPVSGYFKTAPDGKLIATTVNFAQKTASDKTEKAPGAPEKENQPK